MFRSSPLVAIIVSGCVLASCGQSSGTARAPGSTPASEPQAAPAAAAAAAATPVSVADFFPPGAGRDQVLDACGSCHPVACSARGQRTVEQWDRIKASHSDKMSNLSAENLNTLFSYLKANFNDAKPEPQIPAEFLQQGCTPF